MVGFLFLLTIQLCGADSSPTAYPLQYPVNLDGRYTNQNEWSDVVEMPLDVGISGTGAYFSAKYDSSYLYTMWDFIECRTPFSGNDTASENDVYMYLNPTNKPSETVDPSMWRILVASGYGVGAYFSRGTSDGDWTSWSRERTSEINVDSRYQYTSSPHSPLTHWIVEIRFALSGALKKVVAEGRMGVTINFYDGFNDVRGGYPHSWRYKDPSTWASLEFSQEVVPEFPAVALPLVTSILLIFSLAKPRGRKTHCT